MFNLTTGALRPLYWTSADAAGLPIFPGLVRYDEVQAGAINHALRFTLPAADINPQYLYPASHVVGVSPGSNNLPLGARLRLMNTPAVNAVIGTLGPQARMPEVSHLRTRGWAAIPL